MNAGFRRGVGGFGKISDGCSHKQKSLYSASSNSAECSKPKGSPASLNHRLLAVCIVIVRWIPHFHWPSHTHRIKVQSQFPRAKDVCAVSVSFLHTYSTTLPEQHQWAIHYAI